MVPSPRLLGRLREEDITPGVTAANCSQCHRTQYDQYMRSRHSGPAWAAVVGKKDFSPGQVAFFDPGVVGNVFFNTNGQNFLIKGIETSLVARVVTGLTLQGAASWNQSRQTNSPILFNNNPQSAGYGKQITYACNSFGLNCQSVTNPFGPVGSPSADAPPMQFSLRARYDWRFSDYAAFVNFGASYTGSMNNQPSSFTPGSLYPVPTTTWLLYNQPSYTVYDAQFGVAKNRWQATLYGANLGNSSASLFTSSAQFIKSEVPLRPRVLGLRIAFSY